MGIEEIIVLIILVVASVLAYALAPKPPKPLPASLSEFQVPVSTEGQLIPVVQGDEILRGPNVVWYGDLSIEKAQISSGKK